MRKTKEIIIENLYKPFEENLVYLLNEASSHCPKDPISFYNEFSLDKTRYIFAENNNRRGIFKLSDIISSDWEQGVPDPVERIVPNALKVNKHTSNLESIKQSELAQDLDSHENLVVRFPRDVPRPECLASIMKWNLPVFSIVLTNEESVEVTLRINAKNAVEWESFAEDHKLFFLNQGADASFLDPCNLMSVKYNWVETYSTDLQDNYVLYLNSNPDGFSIISKLGVNNPVT